MGIQQRPLPPNIYTVPPNTSLHRQPVSTTTMSTQTHIKTIPLPISRLFCRHKKPPTLRGSQTPPRRTASRPVVPSAASSIGYQSRTSPSNLSMTNKRDKKKKAITHSWLLSASFHFTWFFFPSKKKGRAPLFPILDRGERQEVEGALKSCPAPPSATVHDGRGVQLGGVHESRPLSPVATTPR